jgi:pimeloyl-ACP methyl ester carboxylesterase
MIMEALRPAPPVPDTLAWAPEIPIQYMTVHGHRLRYIKTGRGPNLVLLHTLRTQLDIFQKVIPPQGKRFTVYALDYPGHGYSDIPTVDYKPMLFVGAVTGFLDQLDIQDTTLAGISIGGTKNVVSINPHDYAKGRGIRRGSLVANLVFGCGLIPILGETVMRFRNRLVERMIFEGGVAEAAAIPPHLMEELYRVGTRPGHYRAFLNLVRNADDWDEAHASYKNIQIPVLLVYGEHDWSQPHEPGATLRDIPGARMETVVDGKHLLSLDRPREVVRLITEFSAC